MSLFSRLFARQSDERAPLRPLYGAIIGEARRPIWYADGGVPDTLDGRFDMLALVLTLVLVRLEREGEAAQRPSVLLTETFIDDMDGQLRQMGIGDVVVGKHIGQMMSALGGRLTVYRAAFGGTGDVEEALLRNLYRGEAPAPGQLARVAAEARALHAAIDQTSAELLLAGSLRG